MDIGLVRLDPEGRVLDRNPAAADLLGVELRHLGTPIDPVVGSPLAPLTQAQRPDTGGLARRDACIPWPGGGSISVDWT